MLPRSARGRSRQRKSRRLSLESLESRQLLTITVTTLVDEVDGSIDDGDVSLRDAIAAAPTGEVIDFDVEGVITMDALLGEISIDRDVVILGPDAAKLTIANPPTSRVFSIAASDSSTPENVIISGLTLSATSAAEATNRLGGAIYASGVSLTLADVVIEQNTVAERGGAIFATGDLLQISDSTIRDNRGKSGGGIFARVDQLLIEDSTITGNTAAESGGGLFFFGFQLEITDSTVSANQAGLDGGGVQALPRDTGFNPGTVHFERARLIDNTALRNGGGSNSYQGMIELRETTVQGNQAEGSGGGWNVDGRSTEFRVYDSRLTANRSLFGTGGAVNMINDSSVAYANATLSRSVITGNQASKNGGGLYLPVYGIHTVSNSWLVSNVSEAGHGGGIATEYGSFTYRTGSLDISSSTLAYNSASKGNGGAVFADNLSVSNSTIRNNIAEAGGGVTALYGHALLNEVTLTNNSARDAGGAILVGPDALEGDLRTFELRRSTVSDNTAGTGGGLTVYTRAVIRESVIARNSTTGFGGGANLSPQEGVAVVSYSAIYDNRSSTLGGGLFVAGESRIENATISGNTANISGGGVRELIVGSGEVKILHSTIAFNSAANGGGLTGNSFNLSHAIVANNSASTGDDVNAVVAGSQSLILEQDGLGGTSTITDTIFAMDPQLEPLADNGGFAPTHAISESSPAFDAGAVSTEEITVAFDQRGLSRLQGAAVDLGAFEIQIVAGIWQNPDNPADVNGMDGVTLLDALQVVNELNERRFSQPVTGIITSNLGGPPFLDVNGDGMITPLDALQALNAFDGKSENLVAGDGLANAEATDKELAGELADAVFGQL